MLKDIFPFLFEFFYEKFAKHMRPKKPYFMLHDIAVHKNLQVFFEAIEI